MQTILPVILIGLGVLFACGYAVCQSTSTPARAQSPPQATALDDCPAPPIPAPTLFAPGNSKRATPSLRAQGKGLPTPRLPHRLAPYPYASSAGSYEPLPPGVYRTFPYTCLLVVPGLRLDEGCIVPAPKIDPQMPKAPPESRIAPHHQK